jgi:hypothetical protein
MRKCNLAKYAKRKFLSGYAKENVLLVLLINHIIIIAPFLTDENPASRH